MRAEWDAVVVGAGPVGSEAARKLAEAGRSVVLLEEHDTVGAPVQCGGLVHPRLFDLIAFDPAPVKQHEVRGARVFSPNGTRFDLDAGETHAIAMDRGGFDRALAQRAKKAGADLRTGHQFKDARRVNGHVELDVLAHGSEPQTLRTKLVIGADGVGSETAHAFRIGSWGNGARTEVLAGYEMELSGMDIPDVDKVDVYTGRDVSPGFFGWLIPTSRTRGRLGLCVAGQTEKVCEGSRTRWVSAKEYYDRLCRLPFVQEMLPDPKPELEIVGTIPVKLSDHLVADNVMLVGDAAGCAKPTSGGGIFMGCTSAHVAARVANDALGKGDLSARRLARYKTELDRGVGRELRKAWWLRRAFLGLSDADLDRLARTFQDPKVRAVANRHGDIDFPSRMVWPLLFRKPSLARYVAPALRGLVFGTT